mmetsp:Transcript_18246/g.39180  ORF Transcript_18246/g.39180 Transcript_18246/m.39180 type:complete len:234 (-) Transcript_18246:363-1064(-)
MVCVDLLNHCSHLFHSRSSHVCRCLFHPRLSLCLVGHLRERRLHLHLLPELFVFLFHFVVLLRHVPSRGHNISRRGRGARGQNNSHQGHVISGLLLHTLQNDVLAHIPKIVPPQSRCPVDQLLAGQNVKHTVTSQEQDIPLRRFPRIPVWHARNLLCSRSQIAVLLVLEGSQRPTDGQLPINPGGIKKVIDGTSSRHNTLGLSSVLRFVVLGFFQAFPLPSPQHSPRISQIGD